MAIDVCSELSSFSISPRISFSHDLNQTNLLLLEDQDQDHDHHYHHHHDRRRLDSSPDFDFCIFKDDDDFTFEFSSADELFSNGKILPVEIKTKEYGQKLPDPPEPPLTITARVNFNSSSNDLEKKNINLEEYSQKFHHLTDPEKKKIQKFHDLPELFSTSAVDSSNSTGPEKRKINLKEYCQKSPDPPKLLSTSTIDNSNSTVPEKKRINLIEYHQKSPDPPKLVSASTVDKTSNSTGPEKKITRLKELLSSSADTDEDEDENEDDEEGKTRRNSNYKSFWQFRRSTSLNFDKIKSFHFMSRSNSTGSVSAAQQKPKPGLRKQQSLNSSSAYSSAGRAASYYKRTSSFSGGANYCYSYGNSGSNNVAVSSKGFPRKNNSTCGSQFQYYHGNNNGVRVVSPVLNLPQPYISKVTVSFFGFGSLFCNGKLRKKKK